MAEINITAENFASEVTNSDKPVIIDFWAPWCGPCRMLGPVIEQLARECEGKIKVGKCNVDEQSDLAAKFGVQSIPYVALIENGKVKASSLGFVNLERLKQALGI